MFDWLKFLPIHTFSPRHFESDETISDGSGIKGVSKRAALVDQNGSAKKTRVDDDEEVGGGDDDE